MRYFLRLAYKGTHYHGWQSQPETATVQETLEKALRTLLHPEIGVTGAGRTDTGVHACEMFAHFDTAADFNYSHLAYRLNAMLPKDIAVFDVIPLHDEAHARFDAKSRTYEYRIHTIKNPFMEYASWFYPHNVDIGTMNEAAQLLLSHTNFECFSKVNTDVGTFNCRIDEAYWIQSGQNLIFTITADRFLRNMVRAIVGTLLNVGLHKIDVGGFQKILNSRNRSEAGSSVPAHGLYLKKIRYNYLPESPGPDGSGKPFEKKREVLQRSVGDQRKPERRVPKPAVFEKACSEQPDKAPKKS